MQFCENQTCPNYQILFCSNQNRIGSEKCSICSHHLSLKCPFCSFTCRFNKWKAHIFECSKVNWDNQYTITSSNKIKIQKIPTKNDWKLLQIIYQQRNRRNIFMFSQYPSINQMMANEKYPFNYISFVLPSLSISSIQTRKLIHSHFSIENMFANIH